MNRIGLSSNQRQDRLLSIDYLKALAILLVIINHSLTKAQQLKIGGPFWITMAVPIFMIVTGFTQSMSISKRDINSFAEYFNKDLLINRLSRILLPYSFIFIIEEFLASIIINKFPEMNIRQSLPLLLSFITGARGPGSYYIPIMIQFIFLFPIMVFLFRKSAFAALAWVFLIQLSFDAFANFLPISHELYRLLIFRYLVFIIMGIALYYYKNFNGFKTDKKLIVFPLISIIYIYITNYYVYVPKLFSKWTGTSLPTVFYTLAIVVLGMKYLEIKNTNALTRMLILLGRASFHIFLVQKVVFRLGLKKISPYIDLAVPLRPIFAILLCSTLGIAFYFFERKIRKTWSK